MAMNGRPRSSSSSSATSVLSERSPLLRALGRSDSAASFEGGTYMALPPGSVDGSRASDAGQFQPIVYAERALGALLNGVLLYALCCVVGVALVALNLEGVLALGAGGRSGARLNWWLVFAPFWLANAVAVGAHAVSIRHAKQLRRWADVEAMSNEPLLPLLRRIVVIYAVSCPLALLLLWSQLAFCARLEHVDGASLYVCYAPLMVIQVAFVVRYLLCRSDSTLPVRPPCSMFRFSPPWVYTFLTI